MFNIKEFFNKKEESNEDQEVDSSLTNRIKEKEPEPISYFDEKKTNLGLFFHFFKLFTRKKNKRRLSILNKKPP
jgi:hypothetical protein